MSSESFNDLQKVCYDGFCMSGARFKEVVRAQRPHPQVLPQPCLGGLCGLRPLNPYLIAPWYRHRWGCKGCCSSCSSSSSSCCSSSSSSCC